MGQVLRIGSLVFGLQVVETADIQHQVELPVNPIQAGDITLAQIDLYSRLACFALCLADGAANEIYSHYLPAMLRQGYGVCPGAAAHVKRMSRRVVFDESHHFGWGDPSIPARLT